MANNLGVRLYMRGAKGKNHIFPYSVKSASKLGAHLQSIISFGNVVCEINMKNKDNPYFLSLIFLNYLKSRYYLRKIGVYFRML